MSTEQQVLGVLATAVGIVLFVALLFGLSAAWHWFWRCMEVDLRDVYPVMTAIGLVLMLAGFCWCACAAGCWTLVGGLALVVLGAIGASEAEKFEENDTW